SKSGLNPGLLKYVLQSTLITAHPFAPYITEVIWRELEFKKGHLLAAEPLPQVPKADTNQAQNFEEVKEVIVALRQWSRTLDSYNFEFRHSDLLEESADLVERLSRATHFSAKSDPGGLKIPLINHDVYIGATKEKGHKYLQRANEKKSEVKASVKHLEA